jgi:hypothetical protein
MLLVRFVVPEVPTTGMISPPSTTKLSLALSLTCTMFLRSDFHFGRSPPVARPTPISLHFFGGLTPISTRLVHIRSPLLFHLSMRASYSSSEGCHLLFKMRRIASEETLKCSASIGVVNLSGAVLCRWRMPSMVSGESFLRGFHASPPSFSFKASFCIAQCGRSGLDGATSSSSSSTTVSPILSTTGFAGVGMLPSDV